MGPAGGNVRSLYEWRTVLRQWGVVPIPQAAEVARHQARQLAILKWKAGLANAGLRIVGAIRSVLKDWVDRRHGGVSLSTGTHRAWLL